jgi:hypothetical protein
MAQAIEATIGRREFSREEIDLPARFVTATGSYPARLINLASAGARIASGMPNSAISGRLHWLGFTLYADVVWQHAGHFGLIFDLQLDQSALKMTLQFHNQYQKDPAGPIGKLAAAWVHGPGDW